MNRARAITAGRYPRTPPTWQAAQSERRR